MNNFSAGMEKADLDIDDEEMELMEMMERVAKKAKPKSEVKPEELEDE